MRSDDSGDRGGGAGERRSPDGDPSLAAEPREAPEARPASAVAPLATWDAASLQEHPVERSDSAPPTLANLDLGGRMAMADWGRDRSPPTSDRAPCPGTDQPDAAHWPDGEFADLICRLGRFGRLLQDDMTAFFAEGLGRCRETMQQRLEADRRTAATALAAKAEEVEGLKCDLGGANQRVAELRDRVSRLARALGGATIAKGTVVACINCFQAWRQWVGDARRMKLRLRRALYFYDVKYLKRGSFECWRGWTRSQQRANAKERVRERVAAARAGIEEEFRGRVRDLEGRLGEMEERLREERALRKRQEEEMRKAFMRGVCALNLEALGVMRCQAGAALPQFQGMGVRETRQVRGPVADAGLSTGRPSKEVEVKEEVPQGMVRFLPVLASTCGSTNARNHDLYPGSFVLGSRRQQSAEVRSTKSLTVTKSNWGNGDLPGSTA
eukprot:evm.model.scf_2531EXC.2 EVM.evm.TU.scf_2531EXC.2   scf_2531EXC:16861-18265(-)